MVGEPTAEQREEIQNWQRKDWTVDVETHRSNSSYAFQDLITDVDRIIRDSAHSLIGGRSNDVARSIMAHMAHRHGLMIVTDFDIGEEGKATGRIYYRDRYIPMEGQLSDVPESFEIVED